MNKDAGDADTHQSSKEESVDSIDEGLKPSARKTDIPNSLDHDSLSDTSSGSLSTSAKGKLTAKRRELWTIMTVSRIIKSFASRETSRHGASIVPVSTMSCCGDPSHFFIRTMVVLVIL